MYLSRSFRATISQKSNYLIRHYAISGFGWTHLYILIFPKNESESVLVYGLRWPCPTDGDERDFSVVHNEA